MKDNNDDNDREEEEKNGGDDNIDDGNKERRGKVNKKRGGKLTKISWKDLKSRIKTIKIIVCLLFTDYKFKL